MKNVFRRASLLLGLLLIAAPASAQVHLGADLMSRYVWRGFDFGESFSIQPTLEYSTARFSVGTWASYSIAADGSAANEHDLYASYTAGPVTFGLTDYYFPAPPSSNGVPSGAQFFNFDSDGEGAHYLEPSMGISGPDTFPISVYGAIVAYNDPDNSIYLEAQYPFTVDDVEIGITAGIVPMESAFYGTTGPAFVNAGLSVSKTLPITETFSLPIGVSYIINPYTERSFLVFGLSL